MNFEMQLRQTINEWRVLQNLLKSNAVQLNHMMEVNFWISMLQSWLNVLENMDKAYNQMGQNILKLHYCTCQPKSDPVELASKLDSSTANFGENTKVSLSPVEVSEKASELVKKIILSNASLLADNKGNLEVKNAKDSHAHLNFFSPQNLNFRENGGIWAAKPENLEEEKSIEDVVEKISINNRSTPSNKVNSLKVGELQNDDSEGDQGSSTTKEKPKKYSVRLDVVKKTIFRGLKKYYTNEWKLHCDKTIKDSVEVFQEAQRFITKMFGTRQDGNMHLYLVALIDNKKKFSHPEAKYDELRAQIASMLSCFNKNKIDKLLQEKEFSLLVHHFLSQPVGEIFKDRDDPEVLRIYQSQMEELKGQCEKQMEVSS